MKEGFEVDLDAARKAADQCLDPLATFLAREIEPFTDVNILGNGDLGGDALQGKLTDVCDNLVHRQRGGCTRIFETAEALRSIVSLYRRVDGQK
jgi:hypothetical protein